MKEKQTEPFYIGAISGCDAHCFPVPVGFILCKCDKDLTILEANERYFTMLGFTRKELWEKFQNKGMRLFHPDDIKAAFLAFWEQVEQNKDCSFSMVGRHIDNCNCYQTFRFCGRVFYEEEQEERRVSLVLTEAYGEMPTSYLLKQEYRMDSLISSLMGEMFFDCDIQARTMRYSQAFANCMGIPEFVQNYPEQLLEMGMVFPDCRHLFYNRFSQLTHDIVEEQLHLCSQKGVEYWFAVRYRVIADTEGVPIRAVGKMNDITKQKRKIDELTEKAERDHLTGLYNKGTIERMIQEMLCIKGRYALLVLDMDNFKQINDTKGHHYGDKVLIELAEQLRMYFCQEELLGRVGGDEFFVFLKNNYTEKHLKKKVQGFCDQFSACQKNKDECVRFSVSIGVACYPEMAHSYEKLYEYADTALYIAKGRGKNRCAIFHDDNRRFCTAKTGRYTLVQRRNA